MSDIVKQEVTVNPYSVLNALQNFCLKKSENKIKKKMFFKFKTDPNLE